MNHILLRNKGDDKITENKGNNKIIEHRAIFQRERQNSNQQADKISQQPENCEKRNGPHLIQAFLKKWWLYHPEISI